MPDQRAGGSLLESVRLVHGRDTCDDAGRPLSTYTCNYHEGYQDALDGWEWRARQVTDCEGGSHHGPAGVHLIVRGECGAAFMSTDAGIALGMAQAHARRVVSRDDTMRGENTDAEQLLGPE